jgi:carbon-monoxide dehydrogenase medium subunit
MRPFLLDEADDLQHALTLLAEDGDAHLIAGGTSVMLLINLGLMEPSHLVSLRRVTELRGIASGADGSLEIKAMTTHRHLELSPLVGTFCPALQQTFGHVATVRIRNQGTLGGNLAHADPAQDPPPMLIALDASVELTRTSGSRRVQLEDLSVGYLSTVMQPDEILTGVYVPPLPAGTRATYVKFLPRTQDDYATVSVAATLRMSGELCEDVHVALGSVGPTPIRARSVEDALRGKSLTDATIAEAAALVTDLVDPPDDARGSAAYKRRMARVWTERALKQLRDQPNGVGHA